MQSRCRQYYLKHESTNTFIQSFVANLCLLQIVTNLSTMDVFVNHSFKIL
jgi:hypothetical protein